MSESTPTTANPAADDSGVEADDLNTTTIVMVGLVSTALVLASALGVKALFQTYVSLDKQQKVYASGPTEAESILQQQDESLLGAPKAIQGKQGVYSVPIDLAMKLVVDEQSAGSE